MPRPTHPYVSIKAKWHYLYRAVDKQGRTIDFLLRPDRGIAAAQAFFRKAVATNHGGGAQSHARWARAKPPGTLAAAP